MTRTVALYIKDIIQNMADVEEFIQGFSFETFISDKKTFNAVVRSIEVIGEATKNIPESIRSIYPDIPWKEMAGMRDKLIHFYFGVDREAVWLTVKERIPTIRPIFELILRDMEKNKK
ncbi:MAG: DUF86 domain-containing protein [Desulfobacterales bacterium]|uniref:DUF86 domain-containing protein n=1 Tax=Candidatus Desulfatibia profunda TaxID=2841695 RepID=A0A8J6TIL2_9BACT|nr:DUF86 domain-containing protein [Candidatus Desulfatibia profunda]MBL7179228.1 DUF86 domain-containing protein [Desulfobacterales bacterium]